MPETLAVRQIYLYMKKCCFTKKSSASALNSVKDQAWTGHWTNDNCSLLTHLSSQRERERI